jgi:hypothetical protein
MARIRSIKPDFWKSEAIAAHTFRARLTFIGLWSYVDDNGVGLDNPKLIAAELFALEDDPREALANVREDLASLHEAGRIVRYTVGERSYLAIKNWREHQKIDKPGKPRYPEPEDPRAIIVEPVTSEKTLAPQVLATVSREPRETVEESPCLEQGAGSREQGTGNREVPPSAGRALTLAPAALDVVVPTEPPSTTDALVAEWIDHCAKRPPGPVIGQVGKQIKAMLAEGIDPADVRAGLAEWARKGIHPSTLPSVVNEVMNAPTSALQRARGPSRLSTGDRRLLEAQAALRAVKEEMA